MRKSFGKKPYCYPQPVFMIATYNEDNTVDCMTLAWGMVSDYDKMTICISYDHKTTQNILRTKALTLSIADVDHYVEADYLGIVSVNKDKDKFEKSGLHVTRSILVNAPIIEEFPIVLEASLLSYDKESELMTIQIEDVKVKEECLDKEGHVDVSKVKAITYDSFNRTYVALGEVVGNAFRDGLKIK